MPNIRSSLKRAYAIIEKSLDERALSPWITDNFYIIDRHYKSALGDKKALSCGRMYLLISRCCRERDYIVPPKALIKYLSAQNTDFGYTELCSVRTLISVCVIEKIAEISAENKGESMLPDAIKLLQALDQPEYDDIIPSLWKCEEILLGYEKGYADSDNLTKGMYRKSVSDHAKRLNTDEHTALMRLIERAERKKAPLGSLLFAPDKRFLLVWSLVALAVFAVLLAASFCLLKILSLLLVIPFAVTAFSVADITVSAFVPPYRAPRLNLSSVPDDAKTLVAVASLMTGGRSDDEVFESLSRFRYMNPDDNIYFCLLADLPDSDNQYLLEDKQIIERAQKNIDSLNRIHGDRFCMLFRERVLNKSESKYGGWERKRGAVCELISHIVQGDKSEYYGSGFIRDIKYVLTLDSDTNLSVGSVNELLSVALHPVNRPIIKNGYVVSGYGIIQPTVRTELKSAYRTGFSRLISGAGGFDSYANAMFVRSQTLFGSGSFCGKGLIDAELFHTLVSDKIPQGLVLSHDVIEGSILHTLAASDITLTDSTPGNTVSFFRRQHRWMRGDFQNLYFLLGDRVDRLSKLRIVSTALRHLSPLCSLSAVIAGAFLRDISGIWVFVLAYSEFLVPLFFTLARFLFSGSPFACLRFFSKAYSMLTQSLMRVMFEISSGARRATLAAHAFVLAIYRLFTRRKTLEWTTAAQTEKLSSSLGKYVLDGVFATFIGLVLLVFARPPFVRFLGLLYFVYPLVALVLSRNIDGGGIAGAELTERQIKTLRAHISDMFSFYGDNVNEETNHLPPDNVQLSPVYDRAMRTSPTNIGFYLVSLLAAMDLGLLSDIEFYERLEHSISTVERLDKYRGNLYNWYDISNLSVIGNRYVSAVDSGNFVVMLVALKEGLREYIAINDGVSALIDRVETLIKDTDLSVFYDTRRDLFRIGLNADSGEKDNSCYDMLMSEMRMTAYYAVASSAVPKKHWGALSRTLTHKNGYIGMMSWSGTAFEYLMPQLFLPLYRDSFMYESIAFALMVQRAENSVWGVSESGYYSFDSEMHYQYKANGLQTLSLRRVSHDERIVSPYSTYLSLCIYGNTAMKNLTELEKRGMYGKYGFYEALDLNNDSDGICVKSYMAHHVGMSIIAALNAINKNLFVNRFMSDKRMSAASELLQEKIPIDAHIFEDRFVQYPERKNAVRRNERFTKNVDPADPEAVLLSRGDLNAVVTSVGHIGISCGDRAVSHTVYDKSSMRFSPAVLFSRGGKTFSCVSLLGGEGCSFEKGSDSVSHIASGKEFSACVRYGIAKNSNCLCIGTRAEALKKYDITLVFEPVLENIRKFQSHISFSRLFIESEYDKQKRILYFHRRSGLDGRHIFTLAVAPRSKDASFSFLASAESFNASSVSGPMDHAASPTDNNACECITPLCLVRSANAEGGRAEFLITCGETKQECVNNIKLARNSRGYYPLPFGDALPEQILSRVLYPSGASRAERFKSCNIGDLWSRGISGDHPIITVDVSESNCKNRTDSVLKAFLALSRACIRYELVFIINDGDGYNRPIERSVRNSCAETGALQYIGRNGGIFLLRRADISEDLYAALKIRARLNIDFSSEMISNNVHANIEISNAVTAVCSSSPLVLPEGAIRSGNGYFYQNGYVVDKSIPPKAPYSYVLTGKRFSSVVTHANLGYTFFDNARERRITSFFGDPKTLDCGERVFMISSGIKYDLCAVSNKVVFKNGRAVYYGIADGKEFAVTVVIPPEFPIKLVSVQYGKGVSAETVFELSPVMGDSVSTPDGIEIIECSAQGNNALVFRNLFGITFPEGYGFAGVCSGSCDKLQTRLSSDANENIFFIGACTSEKGVYDIISRVNKRFLESAITKSEEFADSMIPKITVKTRSATHDVMMNHFLPYQISACRFYARGSFYQSGGAYGFRDQLQDCLSIIYSSPDTVKVHILRCCAHQYSEGSVMHWWHTKRYGRVNRGIKSRCSDDMLYLPLVVCDYLEKTDDFALLDTEVHYVTSPPLNNQSERYEQPEHSDIKESVYLHCLRALSYAERVGRHGLILMGSCDWNDGFSLVGEKGIGESVFTTLLFITVAERFVPICESRGDTDTADHYRESIKNLRDAVEKHAFYNDRYARAICDDGTVLGIEGCAECEIDILTQAFAVFAHLDPARTKTALKTAFSKLYDRKNKIFKLFSPPFDKGRARVGYIRGYISGIRENGGQYSHGALWGALGFLMSGMYEEGLLVLDCINPASRCADRELARLYKNEPYAVSADIYSGKYAGRGGWSWYTGAASWYYRIMLEYVFGLRFGAKNSILSARPIIAYTADITLGTARVRITASPDIVFPLLDHKETAFPVALTAGEHTLELPIETSDNAVGN